MESSVLSRLFDIQKIIKVEKGQFNSYGGYMYRSKEDILEALKPLAHERGLIPMCDDDVVSVADGWVYVRSTAMLVDAETGERVSATGWAREPETKKGMDASQITGTASSYAGKRAFGNLLALDDTKDADCPPQQETRHNGPFVAACTACGLQYQFESDAQMAQSMCRCGNRSFRSL